MTPEQSAFLRDLLSRVKHPLLPGHCHDNCIAIFNEDQTGRIAYVKGLLYSPDISNPPHEHSWLLLDSEIYDPTLELSGYQGVIGHQAESTTRK